MVQRWINASPALEWLRSRLPLSRKAEADWIARVCADSRLPTFVIQTRAGRDIGVIGLTVEESRATLGIAIHEPRYWNRGFGQDAVEVLVDGAFRVLPLQRVELLVLPSNERAIRCYEKAGFTREGLLHRHTFARGSVRDMIIMSVLHEEWRLRRELA